MLSESEEVSQGKHEGGKDENADETDRNSQGKWPSRQTASETHRDLVIS